MSSCICPSLPPSPVFVECAARLCSFFPATDHVHGVLALGQRGQLGLGVVQAHSLPQGPKVTWVALLSTETETIKDRKHQRSAPGKVSSLQKPTFLIPIRKYCPQNRTLRLRLVYFYIKETVVLELFYSVPKNNNVQSLILDL